MSQSPTVIESQSAIVGNYVRVEVTVSTGDSFKISQLSVIKGISGLRMSDWSIVALTFVGNIATVATAGLSVERIVVVAGGVR
jgi:hypothetical protein